MTIYDAVVVGTDGSTRASRAVLTAGCYAQALELPIVVATAFVRPDETQLGPASQRAESPQVNIVASGYRAAVDTAQDATAIARSVAPGVIVDAVAVEGDPAEALIDLTASRGDALLVVGNQGMTGSKRFLLGSVPNKVSHHAVGDLLITRTQQETDVAPPGRILIGTDGSTTATRALNRGLALAEAVAASVTVLTAGLGSAAHTVLSDAEEQAKGYGVDAALVNAPGAAADELLAAAEDHDLLVVGNRGMTGAARFLLGSVPNKVSHHVGVDLLIVRTT